MKDDPTKLKRNRRNGYGNWQKQSIAVVMGSCWLCCQFYGFFSSWPDGNQMVENGIIRILQPQEPYLFSSASIWPGKKLSKGKKNKVSRPRCGPVDWPPLVQTFVHWTPFLQPSPTAPFFIHSYYPTISPVKVVSSSTPSPLFSLSLSLNLFSKIPSPFDSTHLNVCFHLLFLPCQLRFLLGTLNLSTEPGNWIYSLPCSLGFGGFSLFFRIFLLVFVLRTSILNLWLHASFLGGFPIPFWLKHMILHFHLGSATYCWNFLL